MVGLVLDGGSAFAQRRDEQSAADLAALAGANDYLINSNVDLGDRPAPAPWPRPTATRTARMASSSTSRSRRPTGPRSQVDISAPHRNNFSSILGMTNWHVATTAMAQAGYPDSANGAGPIIFSIDAFGPNGQPLAAYGNPNAPYDFGEGNGDIPRGPSDIAWTNYGTGNVNTIGVRRHHRRHERHQQDDRLRRVHRPAQQRQPHRRCTTTSTANLSGQNIPVPVVDHNGNFQGWATFHVVSAERRLEQEDQGLLRQPVRQRATDHQGMRASAVARASSAARPSTW